MIDQQQREMELAESGNEPVPPFTAAWVAAVSAEQKPETSTRLQLTRLARDILDTLLAVPQMNPATAGRRAQAAGRALAAVPHTRPDVLARTLKLLGRELAPVARSPEQLTQLLSGLTGGYVAALQAEAAATRQELTQQVGERLRAEAALREQTDRLRHLSDTHLAILAAESLPAIVDLSIQLVNSMIPSLSTTVIVYDFPAGEFEVLFSDQPKLLGLRRPILLPDLIVSLRQGGVYYVEDMHRAPARDLPGLRTAIELGGRSFLAVPMLYEGELFGAFTMTTAQVHGFTAEEIEIAREIANATAVAIQQRRLLEAERRAREREATLREMAAVITAGLELGVVLNTILSQLERVLPSTSSSLILLEGDTLTVAAARGMRTDPVLLADLIQHNPPTLMAIVRLGKPETINDTHADPTWVALPGGEHIRSWVGVPLIVKGVGIGILTLDRDKPYSFDAADVELALAFAYQAAVAIENARLFRQEHLHAEQLEQRVQERTRELEALYGITAATVESADLQTVLDQSLRHALTALHCTAGVIFLIAGDSDELAPASVLSGESSIVSQILSHSTSELLQRCLDDNTPYVTAPADLAAGRHDEKIFSIACAPLRSGNQVFGVLTLLSPDATHFAQESLKLLVTIADQIGAAVENIELRQKIRQTAIVEERERLATELHDAVTQSLYSLSLFAEAARESARAGDLVKVERHMLSIQQLTREALAEMRLLLFELRTEVLAQKGLVNALSERLATVEQRAGIDIELHAELTDPLPVAVEETFYRLALEALNNSLRHAHASKVEIDLRQGDGWLTMVAQDDGVGFSPEQAAGQGGMGMNGMRRRIKKLDGILTVTSTPGKGTRIEIRAPLQDSTAADIRAGRT